MEKITQETNERAKWLLESNGNCLHPEGNSDLIRILIENQNEIIGFIESFEPFSMLMELLKFSSKYEINIQFWPDQTAVFIEKDGVELKDFGGDFDFAIGESLKYLKRINKH